MSGKEQNRKVPADIPAWTPDGFGIPTGAQEPTIPLQINATAHCESREWQSIPGFSLVEFRILNPELRLQLKGETLSANLDCEVETRSTARKPNGEPWIQVTARFTGGLNASRKINLQFQA